MDRPLAAPRFRRGHAIAAALALLMALTFGVAYVRFGLTRVVTVDAAQLTVATVRRAVFHDYIPLTGTVVPRVTVYLDAPTGGQVAEILAEEGATVSAGQPIVVLNNANMELDVMGREAALAQQLYQLTTINQSLDDRRLQRARDLTEIDYQIGTLSALLDRKRGLLNGGYVARTDIDDLERNVSRYRRMYASVSEAQAVDDRTRPQQVAQLKQSIDLISNNLILARKNLDNLKIKAPVAGVLTAVDVEIGQAKAPGQHIGQIDSADDFKVRAAVDEFYLARVVVGQQATVEIAGRPYVMDVAKVFPGVKDRQFTVDLKFIGGQPALRRGQTLNIKLEMGEAGDSLVVDNGAFYDDGGGQWAFVLTPGGAAADRRPISLGRRNPESIEVLKGLDAGTRVIVSTYSSYLDFDRINIQGAIGEGAP
jgi:HlyD family secretion protein